MLDPRSRCYDWKVAIEARQEEERGVKATCESQQSSAQADECQNCTAPTPKYSLNWTTYRTAASCLAMTKGTCSGYTFADDTDVGEFHEACSPGDVLSNDGSSCHDPKPCWDDKCKDQQAYSKAQCDTHRAPGADSFDEAVRQYCRGLGRGSAECACMNFPDQASPWCDRATVSCRPDVLMPQATDDERKEACYAQEFLQSTKDGYAAVQFSRCNPLPCWYEPCLAGPDQRLITTRMGDIQAGGCAGVCYQVQGADTLRYPVSASPLPASANLQNKFATAVISKCGQATNDRPLITMKSLNVELAQNQDKRAQVAINNEGDTGVMVTVTTGADQPWIGTNVQGLPTYVPARGSTQIVVEWDQSIVGESSGKTFAGTVTVSYNDGVQGQQTQATVNLTVVDPVAPVTRTTKGIPREFIYGSAGLLVGAVVLAGLAFAKNSSR